ncbi:MAG: hypothetical protein H6823_11425 [Planctomycetaceae bacterium]|nr:hypothetical protein [Planctomycetaceae bacterium]
MTNVVTQEPARREITSTPNLPREAGSLLGPVGRGMRLKVSRDDSLSSSVIELASRRCLVGSAPNCDVRVNEAGVAPIECLIFHGTQNNVVRWLDASQEFAGGELFEDEILRAGDPLQIGPVELELLIDEIMASDASDNAGEVPVNSEDRLAEYIARLERLELQLIELQQASDTAATSAEANSTNREFATSISDLASQLAELQSRSSMDRDLWFAEKAELEALLQTRLGEFDALQAEVHRLRDELQTARNEYESAAEEGLDARLADVSQVLAERTEEFEQEQTSWQRERGEFQRLLQENMDRLEQFESQLAEQNERQSESEQARQAAESRADRLQASVEELSQRLAEQQEEYESLRAAWEADRAALESELTEAKQQLAQSVATESVELELRDAWEREKKALQTQIDESKARLAEAEETLENQRRELLEDRQRPQSVEPPTHEVESLPEATEQTAGYRGGAATYNPMDRLLASGSSDDDEADEYADRLRDFVIPRSAGRNDSESEPPASDYRSESYQAATYGSQNDNEPSFESLRSTAYLSESPEEEESFENSSLTNAPVPSYGSSLVESDDETVEDEAEEIVFETAASTPPVSTADVLAKLGQSVEWDEEEPETDVPADSRFNERETPEESYSQLQFTPVEATPFNSSSGKSAAPSDEEEESIEAYMARLMNRVRATDSNEAPAKKPESAVDRRPVTEYTEVKPLPAKTPEPEKFNAEEYKPRSQAPEMADRMTAMRSLANDSARSAIASHAKRNWSSVMKLKLFVSIFAFVAVLASVVFFWGNPLLMGLGSLVGFGVLIYWARTVIAYRKLLLASLMLEPNGGSDADQSDDDDE